MPFVNSCHKKAPIATLNTIVINSRLTKECAAFSNVSVFGVQTETDHFQNASFSNLCVFISVFVKLPFHRGAM